MNYENIHLLLKEKHSLFLFHFKKRRIEKKIKCYKVLYFDYQFIEQNYTNEDDEFGNPIFDGTYSISDNYRRYKAYVRKKRIQNLPNWVAISISLVSLGISAITLLWQLGYLFQ